jgi:hypothetical protein
VSDHHQEPVPQGSPLVRGGSAGTCGLRPIGSDIIIPIAVVDQNVAEWLTIVGFPATLVGVAVAIQQASKARRKAGDAKMAAGDANTAAGDANMAAKAAEAAARRAERRIADNQLLLMIPQMSGFRRDLDLAVDQQNRQDTLRLLGGWPILASELQGILERLNPDGHKKLIGDLRRSGKLTGKAKNSIIAGNEDLVPATESARELIDEICSESSTIVGTMKAFTRSME